MSALNERVSSTTDVESPGIAASSDRSAASIAELFRIVGPIVLGLAGTAIRLEAFLRNLPLSQDEAAIARNIIDRPGIQVVGWLDYSQLAPPGFLLVEKAIVSAVGSSELALRAFPFLCAVLSVWLCWALCRRILPTVPALLAFGLFSLNTSIIDFGMRAKPYAGDVAAALAIALVASKVFDPAVTRRRTLLLALASTAICFFSFPSIFAYAGAAVAGLSRARREPARRDALLAAVAMWIIAAACGTLIAKMSLSPADSGYMRWYWQPGFMPFPPGTRDDVLWAWRHLRSLFRWTLLYRVSALWVVATTLGIWSLARRKTDIALLLTTPLLLVLGASAARQYPFYSGRITLFLIPGLIILASEGAEFCRRAFANRLIWVGIVPSLALVALGTQATWSGWRIQRNGDVRAPLQYVRQHWQAGDRLFVDYPAGQAFMYYAPRLGFSSRDYVVSSCSDETQRTALWEAEALRGTPRVWVLSWEIDETDLLFRYLAATATVRDTFTVGGKANGDSFIMRGAAILYDLAVSRQPAVTPATFAMPAAPDGTFDTRSCYGVFNSQQATNPGNR